MEFSSRLVRNDDGITEEEINEFDRLYPNNDFYLAAGRYEKDDCLTFFKKEGREINYKEWSLWNQINISTSFEKIFFPILNSFRDNYINQ